MMSIQLLRFNSSRSAGRPDGSKAGWLPRDKPHKSGVHVLASNDYFVKVRFKKTTRHTAGLKSPRCDGQLRLFREFNCLLQIVTPKFYFV
jgi:hypothetical protein